MRVLRLQIQMKDFRFSYKFKMACKEDVLRLCPNIKKKSVSSFPPFLPPPLLSGRRDLTLSLRRVDVVICLSTTVRNDTLQDAKEQRVSLKCRKQLRVEELEMVAHTPLVYPWQRGCSAVTSESGRSDYMYTRLLA